MFNPDEVKRWFATAPSEPALEHAFGGKNLDHAVIKLADQPGGSTYAPEQIGELRPPTIIFGTPYDPNCLNGVAASPIFSKPVIMHTIRDARVIGNSAVLSGDGRLLASADVQSIGRRELLRRNRIGHDGFMMEEIPDGVSLRFAAREKPRRIPMNALFFHHLEGGNYGSFMFRQLPQMLEARDRGIQFDCYITSGRTSWFQEALTLLGFPARPVFQTNEVTGEVFESISMFDGFDNEGFIHPRTRERLSECIQAEMLEHPKRGRRLYVSRALSGLARPRYRSMRNEADIEDQLRARGFEVIYPETLTLVEQIRTFSSATHLLGPSGSGMFNIMFSPSHARIVDVETFHVTVRQHAKLYSSMGHEYAFVFAPMDESDNSMPAHRSWRLPDELLNQALTWLLSG
ncbi:glycosyltransferase family 61 protein [Lichenicoccus sp.]|uniref:glycosyltransferase family 61 protein n=1 Tax=Lichenicoccus sp. TaxID=2781899 RepID=UPI003D0C3C8E